MIAKKNRLSASQVRDIIRRLRSKQFSNILLFSENSNKNKLGVVVSSKAIKTAVLRNFYKRVIYNLVCKKSDYFLNKIKPKITLIVLRKNPKNLFNLEQDVARATQLSIN